MKRQSKKTYVSGLVVSLLLILSGVDSSNAGLPGNEIFSVLKGSNLDGAVVGYRIHTAPAVLNLPPAAVIQVQFHVKTFSGPFPFLSFTVPKVAIDSNQPISGVTNANLPTGCYNGATAKLAYRILDGELQISGILRPEDVRDAACRSAFGSAPVSISVAFPKLSVDDRIKFGLLPNPDSLAECNVVPGRKHDLAKIVGKKMTVFPNGWAHDADGFKTFGVPFNDMRINSLAQAGPGNWQIKESFVFNLGDQVEVKSIKKAPLPGEYGPVRAFIVEVERVQDGKTAVVDLDQLLSGDVTKCPPVRLLGSDRLVGGVFVKVKQGVRLVVDVTRTWITDPRVRYGYCQDFKDGRFQCQTREYGREVASDWSAQYDEVEILASIPQVLGYR